MLLDLFTIARRSPPDKDREILRLPQPLRIWQRHPPATPRLSRWAKFTLAVLAGKLVAFGRDTTIRLDEGLLLFKPATVLRGHRDLVRRSWTCTERCKLGRPAPDPQVNELRLRLADENPTGGYGKLHGAWLKLGHAIGRSTVRAILKKQQGPPAPERAKKGGGWGPFLRHYRAYFLACDFFTVAPAWLNTRYVFFFIELGRRRVHCAGCTAHPTAVWVTQQARQLSWTLQEAHKPLRFVMRDRAAQFTSRSRARLR